jgi:hypothetical protein
MTITTWARLASLIIALTISPWSLAAKRPADLAATHGYVYVNVPKGGAIPAALGIKSTKTKKSTALELRKDSDLQAYGAWVPAGDYVFSTWDQLEWGEHESFTVQAGRITDLGSLVAVMIGGYEFVPLPLRPQEVSGRVADVIAEFQPALGSEVIEWKPQRLPAPIKITTPPSGLGLVVDLMMSYERKVNEPPLRNRLRAATDPAEFLALAKTAMPPLHSDGWADADGTVYFGADHGQVRVRSPQGEWRSLDTGSIWRVTALNAINGALFVGAQNLIFESNADRNAFRQIAQLPRNEWVTGIDRTDSGWLIASVVPTITYRAPSVKAVRIYGSKSADLSNLTLLKEVAVDDKKALVHYRGTDSTVTHGYYFANAVGELIRIKLETMEAQSLTQPTPAHGFKVSPSGTMAAWTVGGVSSKVFVSTDHGVSWSKKDAPSLLRDVHFADGTSGHAIRDNRGAFTVTQELLSYDSAANKWKKVLETPESCVRMLHDASGVPNLCVTNGGSILARKNEQWAAEFALE